MPKQAIQIPENLPVGVGAKHIRTSIARDGTVQIDAVGFEGRTCESATEALETRIGAVTDREGKDDSHRDSYQGVSL